MSDLYLPSYRLPDRPDAPEYREILAEIENGDVEESAVAFRTLCENDFWAFSRYCYSLGEYLCDDPRDKWYGKPWLDHPWLFDRCRAIQLDPCNKPILRLWPRFSCKSALVTQSHTLWDNILHSDEEGSKVNTLILTFKTEDIGEAFVTQIKRECEKNPKLAYHWPHVYYTDPANRRDGSSEWTTTSLRFKQKGNPKEPSVLVAGITQMPTSGHYQRLKFDDIVVREAAESTAVMDSIWGALQDTGPLCHDNTISFYVGTRWAADDCYSRGAKAGMFVIDHQDCYGPPELPAKVRTVPTLRSQGWLTDLHIKLGPYKFAAQMRNDPTAAAEMKIDYGAFRWYDTDPYKERENGNIYILIDPARSTKKSADYTTILVVKYGADNNKYVLDMYRDRLTLEEFQALLFHLAGDSRAAMRYREGWATWGRGDWRPTNGSKLLVFEEVKGADRDVEHQRMAMDQWSYRFDMFAMPSDAMKKEDRILSWTQELTAGKWFFPRNHNGRPRVGHSPRGSVKDTLEVWIEEEVLQWTATSKIAHDDGLDLFGMISRQRTPEELAKKGTNPLLGNLLKFPVVDAAATGAAATILSALHPGVATTESRGIFGQPGGRSSWVS